MIRVKISSSGKTQRLWIRGHASYGPAGGDIVCAGVSAVAYALLGYLANCAPDSRVTEKPGELRVVCRAGEKALCGFEMARAGMELIAEKYPGYVMVENGM